MWRERYSSQKRVEKKKKHVFSVALFKQGKIDKKIIIKKIKKRVLVLWVGQESILKH